MALGQEIISKMKQDMLEIYHLEVTEFRLISERLKTLTEAVRRSTTDRIGQGSYMIQHEQKHSKNKNYTF